MANNFIIQYPDNGSKASLTFGTTYINFQNGEVITPAGAKVVLSRNLEKSQQDFIRSIAIFTSEVAKIRLGTGQTTKTFLSNFGWNIFENLNIREIEIETFTSGIPDSQELLVIASTSSKSIYNPRDLIFHAQEKTTQASINAYTPLFFKITDKFKHVTFILTEDGTNSITYKVEGKMTGPAAFVEIQGDTVLDGATDIIQIEGSWSILQVSIKSTVGAAHGSVDGQYSGLGG